MTPPALFVVCLVGLAALPPLPVAAEESMAAAVHLNVRTGPGLDTGIVDTLFPGERVLVGTCREDWCPITHVGPDGWVYAPYLVAASFTQNWSAVSGELPATIPGEDSGDIDLGVTLDVAPMHQCPSGRPFC